MHIQAIPLVCKGCNHTWHGQVVNNATFDVAIASMRANHCPECRRDWRWLAIRGNDAIEPIDKLVSMR